MYVFCNNLNWIFVSGVDFSTISCYFLIACVCFFFLFCVWFCLLCNFVCVSVHVWASVFVSNRDMFSACVHFGRTGQTWVKRREVYLREIQHRLTSVHSSKQENIHTFPNQSLDSEYIPNQWRFQIKKTIQFAINIICGLLQLLLWLRLHRRFAALLWKLLLWLLLCFKLLHLLQLL